MTSIREQLESTEGWCLVPENCRDQIIHQVEQVAAKGESGSHSHTFKLSPVQAAKDAEELAMYGKLPEKEPEVKEHLKVERPKVREPKGTNVKVKATAEKKPRAPRKKKVVQVESEGAQSE